ncbi:MAG: right-handed parallel beta-helix repeat-containing protein [Planctomycetota bacterium]|nr:right-handed parallel beta-helix repeat-containing protein [Planctomycetota bacterium]
MFVRLTIVLTLMLAASTCAARQLYVSNVTGNDRNRGLSAVGGSDGAGPLRTIRRAVHLSRPGDEIVIDNTGIPYRECITLAGRRGSGTATWPLIISGNGAVLDGSVPVPQGAWEHYQADIFRFTPRRQTYLRLFHKDRPLVEKPVPPGALSPPPLEPLQWCLLNSQVYFRVEPSTLPDSYQLTQTGHAAGLTLYAAHDVDIRDLVIQGYQLDGVTVHDLVERAVLSGLTCRGNGRSGISVGGASRVVIDQCLLGDNGRGQLRVEAPAAVEVSASDVLDSGVPRFLLQGGRLLVDGKPFRNDELPHSE